ncbi:hypothetical protein JW926_13040 [Candidatus Sumerlaeota bacterium]|nr:hypothetical protein [Candidatus Sumerlaeota bacterium]
MLIKSKKCKKVIDIKIPVETLNAAQISEDDPLDIQAEKGRIIISPMENPRGKYKIEDIVKRMPKNYMPVEMDWGKSKGKEAW